MKKTRVNKVKLSKVTVVEAIMYLPHPLQDTTDFLISLKCCLWPSSLQDYAFFQGSRIQWPIAVGDCLHSDTTS